jgi:hypothetical protein
MFAAEIAKKNVLVFTFLNRVDKVKAGDMITDLHHNYVNAMDSYPATLKAALTSQDAIWIIVCIGSSKKQW